MNSKSILLALSAALLPCSAVHAADAIVHIAARAPGTTTVSRTGNIFSLRFSGDEVIDYRIDLDGPFVAKGRISVYEASSDSWPMIDVNPGYRDGAGAQHSIGWLSGFATLTSATMTADSVVLDYTDNFGPIGEGVRHRRTTFTLTGKMLTVRYQDMDGSTQFARNYIGILQGDVQGLDSPQVLRLMGGMSQPIVRFKNPAGKSYYYSNVLDLYNTNASNYAVQQTPTNPPPSTVALNYSYSTWGQYAALSDGTHIGGSIDDTFRVTVTGRIEETYVTPTHGPSPYRELLTDRMVLLCPSTIWADYPPLWNQLDTWGVDNIAGYFFQWSSSGPDSPSPDNVGPDWWPAVDQAGFQNALQTANAKGFILGAYNSYNTMPVSAPANVYDPSHIALGSNGQPKTSVQFGIPIISTTASGLEGARESSLLRAAGASLGYLDIQTYSSPSRGADGDHIDQRAGSPWAKTLRQACLDQRTWMRNLQDTYQGPLLGEGSILDPGSNYEYLWAGYCDGTERVLNTGTGIPNASLPANRRAWLVSVTGWPVVPDIDWRVYNPLQVNHGNGFVERFFSPTDGPGIVTAAGVPIHPTTEAGLDRYRNYELTFGKAGFVLTNGIQNGIGNYTTHADLLREYHMTNALQSRYTQAPPTLIEYWYAGAYYKLQTLLEATGTLDVFRQPKMHIAFANGLEMWLNHQGVPWDLTIGGVAYRIPQDGFVAIQPSTGLVAFSAIPPTTGGARIDYCLDPSSYEFFDGRGVIGGYGGQSTPFSGVAFTSFSRGRTFRENASGTIIQVGSTVAPALVRVEVFPSASTLAVGARKGLKAYAVYANGARRDVTKLVTWSTQAAGIATVNNGAAVTAVAPGTTNVTISSFQGAPSIAGSLTVQ